MTATADPRKHRAPDTDPVVEGPTEGDLLGDADALRKPVNTLAIVPKSHKITSLGRKSYNVLLHEAQEQGLEKEVFRMPLERVIRGVGFDSNDQELIKKHLRAMVSTTVEWQSPTTGEGSSWNVSGLLAHAKLGKVRGQVWVEWSYAINLKQELLEPTVFARLSLEIISQLRSHAGIALYEICSRYKTIGRTSRQTWQWWRPVLSGRPESEQTARLEYRIFKRDTLKPAIAEVSSVTDIEIELIEHRQGRFVAELQFLIRPKTSDSLPLRVLPRAIDLDLVARARSLGLDDARAEELIDAHGVVAFRSVLNALERRAASSYPEPLRDVYRYAKSLLAETTTQASKPQAAMQGAAVSHSDPERLEQRKRQARWAEEWIRRRRAKIVDDITRLPQDEQLRLSGSLLADMDARRVHPSICKRLRTSGWQHPLVIPEMVRYYALAVLGPDWDRPTPQQLLGVATEVGDVDGVAGHSPKR